MFSERFQSIHPKAKRTREIMYGNVPDLRVLSTGVILVFFPGYFVVCIGYEILFGGGLVFASISLPIFILLSFVLILSWQIQSKRNETRTAVNRLEEQLREVDSDADRFALMLYREQAEAPMVRWRAIGRWDWDSLLSRCDAAGVAVPSTYASSFLMEALEAVMPSDVLLEPETILQSAPKTRQSVLVASAAFLVLGVVMLLSANRFIALMFLACIPIALMGIPRIRDCIPLLRFDGRAPIFGMGYLQDAKCRRWTIDDSIMLLHGMTDGNHPMMAFFVGPSGWKLMTFSSAGDPEFVKLWQRWNHPDPRPELWPDAKAAPGVFTGG